MTNGAQAIEIRKLDALLMAALKNGSRPDQRAYERARRAYCVRYGLPYVAPVWPEKRIAS